MLGTGWTAADHCWLRRGRGFAAPEKRGGEQPAKGLASGIQMLRPPTRNGAESPSGSASGGGRTMAQGKGLLSESGGQTHQCACVGTAAQQQETSVGVEPTAAQRSEGGLEQSNCPSGSSGINSGDPRWPPNAPKRLQLEHGPFLDQKWVEKAMFLEKNNKKKKQRSSLVPPVHWHVRPCSWGSQKNWTELA